MIGRPFKSDDEEGAKPPFFGSWQRIYMLVLIYLALLIGVLYFLSHAWTP